MGRDYLLLCDDAHAFGAVTEDSVHGGPPVVQATEEERLANKRERVEEVPAFRHSNTEVSATGDTADIVEGDSNWLMTRIRQ